MEKDKKERKKNLIKLDSTQKWSPVLDVRDGVVLTKDGRYVQILEFSPINFLLLPTEEQEAIAQAFGSAIRIFPSRFQIKVLARKATMERHIANLRKYMASEPNALCRQMQAESIRQIQQDAVNGISRRFFISFDYTQDSTLRRPSWSEICKALSSQAHQIYMCLSTEPCNNDLISPIGNSDHIQDILYNCLCRSEAEMKSFDERLTDVVCAHIVEQGMPEGEVNIPVNDFICPQKIDSHAFTQLEVDNKHYAFGYITRQAYPTQCLAGWLSALINLGEGIDVDIFVEKKSAKEIQTQLIYAMQAAGSSYRHKSSTSADLVALENKLKSQEYIRQALTQGQDFMYFSILLTIVEDSTELLKERMKSIQNRIATFGLQLRFCHGNHETAFKASLPLNTPNLGFMKNARRNILSGGFGAAYPFTSYEINDPNGVMVGYNSQNGSTVIFTQTATACSMAPPEQAKPTVCNAWPCACGSTPHR